MAFVYAQPMNHWYDQYFSKNAALGSTITSNALCCGGTQGGVIVVVEAATGCTISGSNTVSLTFQHSDTADGPFAAVSPAVSVSVGAGTFAAGDVLMRAIVPAGVKDFVKCVLTGTATGTVNVSLNYLAR